MTHLTPRRIFQSGDFRLTNGLTGKPLDYWAQKQIIVQRFGWTALVGFCGIANTGVVSVPAWVVEQLRATPQGAPFEDFLSRLQSAETWLAGRNPRFRAITFAVGAFVDLKPTFVLISNFEALGRPPAPVPAEFPARLEVSRLKPRGERLFVSGRPDAVHRDERRWVLACFRAVPPPERGYAVLAEVNRLASTRTTLVSAACFTAHATLLGEQGGVVHEWPADQEYLPPFLDLDGMLLRHLKAELDEQGKPKPIQLRGVSGAMVVNSAEYFHLALEEKPNDPSILSNYGNWLKDRGELDGAEVAYRKALASDDAFANAHNNLANLLEERSDIDAAEGEYRRAVELHGESNIYASNLAFFLWNHRGDASGETLLRDALERQRDAWTLGRMARFTDVALGDQDAARQLYEEALGFAPNDPWINGRYADLRLRAGDLDAARENLERATAGKHPDVDALLQYAEQQVREGSIDAGVTLIRRALKARPRNPNALAMLAAARTLAGAPESEIERMYRQVSDWDPGHPIAALNLAQILLRRDGSDEEARRLLLAAATTDLRPEWRLELLFYAVAYDLAGFEGAAVELRSLLDQGARIPGPWDLSGEIAAARARAHPQTDLLAEVARLQP